MAEQRLIDANALPYENQVLSCDDEWCLKVSDIDNAPTIEAVEVVRCKDCLSSEAKFKRNGEVYFYRCNYFDIEIEPLDFCSYGERRYNDAID